MLKTLQSNMSCVGEWCGTMPQWPVQPQLGVVCRPRARARAPPRAARTRAPPPHLSPPTYDIAFLFHNFYTMKTLQRRRAKTMRPEVNRSETLYIEFIVSK